MIMELTEQVVKGQIMGGGGGVNACHTAQNWFDTLEFTQEKPFGCSIGGERFTQLWENIENTEDDLDSDLLAAIWFCIHLEPQSTPPQDGGRLKHQLAVSP